MTANTKTADRIARIDRIKAGGIADVDETSR
jgi:hypothetical protein